MSCSDLIKAVKAQKYPEFPKIDIPKTDLSKVEKKLDEHKKLLKEIVDKPVGGGGGGGGGSSFTDAQGKSVYVTLNPDGSLPVSATINNTLVPEQHDEIQATYPTTSSEVYTYKLSGASVAVVTVTYTDATKEVLTSVVRS
jgi:hypothetical protein